MKIPDIEMTHERFIEAYWEQEYNNLLDYIQELKILSYEKWRDITEVFTTVNDYYNKNIVGNTIYILWVKVKFFCCIRYYIY
jgi:hypothetical protein